jgi:RNA polymerase sigma-70 factor (ECF subfamily)
METRGVGVTTDRDADQVLVDSVLNGNKRAFELLVRKYQRKLMRLVLYFVKDPAEAEDVVQETFIKSYRALNWSQHRKKPFDGATSTGSNFNRCRFAECRDI